MLTASRSCTQGDMVKPRWVLLLVAIAWLWPRIAGTASCSATDPWLDDPGVLLSAEKHGWPRGWSSASATRRCVVVFQAPANDGDTAEDEYPVVPPM